MAPNFKRMCLSAESAMTGRPNIEGVPIGAKLHLIPGNKLQLCRTHLCEKLHLDSCDFDVTSPCENYLSSEYKCLHDEHLKEFFVDRPGMRKKLRKNNFITPERKVVCTLKEYNLYRQYLKHNSIEHWNKKHLIQYEKEYERNKEEMKRKIKEKQEDVNNPIRKSNERAREARRVIEKDLKKRTSRTLRQMEEYTIKREREKKEERRSKIIRAEIREKTRELAKREKAAKEVEINLTRQRLLTLKHQQDIQRKEAFEEKLKEEKKTKEKVLVENYEKRRELRHAEMLKSKEMDAEKETKRKIKVAEWENFFTRQHGVLFADFESIKEENRRTRDERNIAFEERMKARMDLIRSTHADCRKSDSSRYTYSGFGDGSRTAAAQILRQLSAMGVSHVTLDPDILKEENEDSLERSSGDAVPLLQTLSQQAYQFCEEAMMKHGYASEYIRHVIEVARELEMASRDIVTQAIDVSRNVLIPLLEAYEKKTGVKVATTEIPAILHALSAGVFDEEDDNLPQIFSFDDIGRTTMHAESKNSNVRCVVSQTDIPMESRPRKRPQTAKKARLSPTSDSRSDSENGDICSETQLVLEEAIGQLTGRVVQHIFGNNVVESEFDKDEMNERINDTTKSVSDEIILFADEEAKDSSSLSRSEDSGTLLEDKISLVAKQLMIDILADRKAPPKDAESSSAASASSTGSILSVLALKVMSSVLGTVDPKTGKTLRQHVFTSEGLEDRVANLSTKVVEQVIRERSRNSDEKIDSQVYAELMEKISKLALNIATTAIEGKPPHSASTSPSTCSAEIEERVLDLSARIIGGIIKLKQLIQEDGKKNDIPRHHTVSSVESVLREIFDIENLQDAPNDMQKATVYDVQKISDDISRRLVPPRNVSSTKSSGMSPLATVMAESESVAAVSPLRASEDKVSVETGIDQLSHAKEHMPHPPKTDKSPGRKLRHQLKETTQTNPKRTHSTNFSSSFSDWRTSSIGIPPLQAKRKSPTSTRSAPDRLMPSPTVTQFVEDSGVQDTSSEEFNVVMNSFASQIVSSIFANQENKARGNDSQIDHVGSQSVEQLASSFAFDAGSQSVEQLVSSFALGIVTSLLGYDVLNGALSSEPSPEDNAVHEERAEENAPGPSARRKNKGKVELARLLSQHDVEAENQKSINLKPSAKNLIILCPEDGVTNWKKPSCELSCGDDNANEHPHRVRSATRKDRKETRRINPRKFQGKALQKAKSGTGTRTTGSTGSIYPRASGRLSSKLPTKQSLPKSDASSFETTTPLKPSAGFLNRCWFTNAKHRRLREEDVSLKPKQSSRRRATSPYKNLRPSRPLTLC